MLKLECKAISTCNSHFTSSVLQARKKKICRVRACQQGHLLECAWINQSYSEDVHKFILLFCFLLVCRIARKIVISKLYVSGLVCILKGISKVVLTITILNVQMNLMQASFSINEPSATLVRVVNYRTQTLHWNGWLQERNATKA